VITVRTDRIVDDDGRTGEREVVEHNGAVAALVVDDDGQVVLVDQWRHAVGARVLEIAAGKYDVDGETVEDALRRELAEELGVAGPEPRFLFKHRYRGRENPSWSALFEVTWDGPVTPQASEIAWGAFLTLEELDARIQEWPFCPDGLEIFRRWRGQTGV
jgi:8-oxo-dGTP pyrophosphatase MutT (NUDIX family)